MLVFLFAGLIFQNLCIFWLELVIVCNQSSFLFFHEECLLCWVQKLVIKIGITKIKMSLCRMNQIETMQRNIVLLLLFRKVFSAEQVDAVVDIVFRTVHRNARCQPVSRFPSIILLQCIQITAILACRLVLGCSIPCEYR